MRIGVSLDDTICKTTEMVHQILEDYAMKKHQKPLDIINDEILRADFFSNNLEEIYEKAEIKKNAKDVLKRLRNRGNEIYIITTRANEFETTKEKVYDITKKWLKEHDVEVDYIISAVNREEKGEICKKYKIDLMIEDDPYNYKMIVSNGINCILFDDREKYVLKENYVTNWLDIEKYIEKKKKG